MLDLQLQLNILYVIVFVFILYFIYNKTTENFAVTDDVKSAINEVYKADVDAIRNLSAIASKLQAGSYTCPGNLSLLSGTIIDFGSNDKTREVNAGKIGYNVFEDSLNIVGEGKNGESRRTTLWENLKVTGRLSTNSLDPNNVPDGWGGGLRTFDIYSSGSIAAGPDGKTVKAYMNLYGEGGFKQINVGTSYDGVSSTITDARHKANNLCIVGQGVYPNRNTTIWDNLTVEGNIIENTQFLKYRIAGYYHIKAYGYSTPIRYGWTLLWLNTQNTHRVASRLFLYEYTSGRKGTVHNSNRSMVDATDQNWFPGKLIVFPGYCAKFYYWTIDSTDQDFFRSGIYDWTTGAHRGSLNQCVHAIFVTLDTEPVPGNLQLNILNDYDNNTDKYPIRIPGKTELIYNNAY